MVSHGELQVDDPQCDAPQSDVDSPGGDTGVSKYTTVCNTTPAANCVQDDVQQGVQPGVQRGVHQIVEGATPPCPVITVNSSPDTITTSVPPIPTDSIPGDSGVSMVTRPRYKVKLSINTLSLATVKK